jgi:tetratricopeptide (TPR) repeat protein
VQRASDAIGGYKLSDADAPHVGAICRRLDGVAMAIELAAARMTVLKPAEIKRRLDNAFRLLNTGSNNRLPRHQTLWATIDWSHSLLSPQEQLVLRRLSVFVDGFSLDGAVEAVSGDEIDPDDVLDLMSLLVDKSLVNTDKSGVVMRYRMLEATRHYAREKLKASGETGRDRRAADYLARFYDRAESTWPTTPTEAWLAEFAPEVENLRAAIDWAFGSGEKYHAIAGEPGDALLGVALVAKAGGIASEMSLHADIRRWTTAATPHLEAAPKRDAAWVLYWDSKWKSNFGTPIMPQNRALAIAYFREARDVAGLSCALRTAALAIARPGDVPAEAETMLSEAVALLSGGLPDKHLAWALEHMAILQYFKGDLLAARSGFEDVTAMRRRLGDRTGLLGSMINLAELDFVGGAPDSAIVHAREAEAESRRAGSLLTLAHALGNLTGYLLADARVAEAREAGVEALRHYRSLGQDELAIQVIEHLALAHALDGTHHTAARLLGYTEAYFARTSQARDPMEQAGYLRLCALLLQALPGDVMASCKAAGAVLADDAADAAACCDGVEAGVVWAGVG